MSETPHVSSPLARLSDRIRGSDPLPSELAEEAINFVQAGGADLQLTELRELLRLLIAGFDWERYEWENQQLAKGTPLAALDAERQALGERQTSKVQPAVEQIGLLFQEEEEWTESLSLDRRMFECFLGFRDEAVQRVTDALGPSPQRSASRTITDLIPGAFAPPPSGAYHRDRHEFLPRLLAALPAAWRRRQEVICLAGEPLARFCYQGRRAARLRLRQAHLLAKTRLRQDPANLLEIVWALEIALWQRANRVRRRFSISKLLDRFWTTLPGADEAQIRQVLALLDDAARLEEKWGRPAGWEELATPGPWGHVNHLSVHWPRQVEGRFDHAVIAFASRCRALRAETLAQVASSEVRTGVSADPTLLQSREWVWIAEHVRFNPGDDLYDQSWENAYIRADDDSIRLNAIAVMLSRRLLLRQILDRNRGLGVLLKEVEAICHRNPECREQGQHICAACQICLDELCPLIAPFLTASEEEAIRQAGQRVRGLPAFQRAQEGARPWVENYEQQLAVSEQELRRALGSILWGSLQADTKEHFKRGYLAHQSEQGLAQSNYFHASINEMALGVQAELAYWIWRDLSQQDALLRELARCGIRWQEEHERGLGFYGQILRRCGQGKAPNTREWFERWNAHFTELLRFARGLLDFARDDRSPAVHRPRIDRPQAQRLFRRLLNGQFLRRFLLALQGR
jgi:hypothetical protein